MCKWDVDATPCNESPEIRGLCSRHYLRAYKLKILDRFPRVEKDPSPHPESITVRITREDEARISEIQRSRSAAGRTRRDCRRATILRELLVAGFASKKVR